MKEEGDNASMINWLKQYRAANSISQKDMAKKLGISYRTYQLIEATGEVKKVSYMAQINALLSGEHIHNSVNKNELEDPESPYPQKLNSLFESFKILAESNKLLAESNKLLAESNSEANAAVVKLLHNNTSSPVYDVLGMSEVVALKFAELGRLIIKAGTEGWQSRQEAEAELHTALYEQRKGAKQEGTIAVKDT